MGHRAASDQLLVHVRLEGELLHIAVLADADEALAQPVAGVPEPLHDAEHHEHRAVRLHEALAGLRERAHVAGSQQGIDRLGRKPPADHCVVDALARRRRDHAGSVAGQHHVAAVVPAAQRLHRQRRAFAAQRLGAFQAGGGAQAADRAAQREALVGTAGAHAHRVAVREDPAVEVWRQAAAVVHVAARPVEASRRNGRRADDLVIGEHILRALGTRHGLACDLRLRAVGADDGAGPHAGRHAPALVGTRTLGEMDDAGAVGVARDALKAADAALRTTAGRALAQPLVERIAIDHADEAVVDRDVDARVLRRNHPGGGGTRHQQGIRNREVLDQARRNGAAAGLGAAGPVEQQHRAALARQVVRCGGAGRAAADHDHIEGRGSVHACHLDCVLASGWRQRVIARPRRI